MATDWMRRAGGAAIVAAILQLTTAGTAGAAGLLIADGGLGGVLEIEEQSVHVTINNGIAVTQVTQVFRNTENRQVEALYTFPVPGGASVANFSMWINGKEMVGEVVEKKRAREIYDSYKQVRRDPGLLEQTDYKTFEMRIFPIGAGARQKVQVSYYQELDFDHDWATYVYPLATVTRKDQTSRTQGKFALTLEAKSEVPIVEMTSPSHKDEFIITRHDDNYCQASLENKGGDLNRDIVLAYHASRPRTGVDLVASRESGQDGYFCMTLTAGEELADKRTGADYVFILDVSGSMADDGKLALSRSSVSAFLTVLAADDRFEVMTFNVQPTMLFNRLSAVTPESQAKAGEFLASQRARGGTVLKPALAAAFRYADPDRRLNLVIMSDGMTEQEERAALLSAAAAKPGNARIFCIGLGNEVNRPLLEQLARDAGGLAAFISQSDDFKRQADAFRRKLTHPAATNVRIEFADPGVHDVEPRQLPNLYHGMPVRLYGRYRGDKAVKTTVKMDIDGSTVARDIDLNFPAAEAGNPQIERMWAWHRVQSLLGQADRTNSRPDIVGEIVRLGEGYSIATEYTSFIVLENDAEYNRWKIDRKNVTRVQRDRKAEQVLAERLEKMRDRASAALGPAPAGADPKDTAAASGAANPAPAVTAPVASADPSSSRRPSRGFDILPSASPRGGGSVDPITAIIGIGVAALAVSASRFRHER
jgi:Ca-activated chloride channel family protein